MQRRPLVIRREADNELLTGQLKIKASFEASQRAESFRIARSLARFFVEKLERLRGDAAIYAEMEPRPFDSASG